VCVALAAVVAARAHYTADLSAFLPRAPTRAEEILVEQLRDGVIARSILLDIEGADGPTRARRSRDLAARLRADPEFRSVLNGEPVTLARDREFVFTHRYLLSDAITPQHFTTEGLQKAIGDGIDQLASPTGLLARDLFQRDPTGETLEIIAQLDPTGSAPRTQDGVWVSPDGRRALLLVELRSEGSDTDAAERALAAIRRAFAAGDASAAILRMTGPAVFAVQARERIRAEVIRLSSISSIAIVALLLIVYRSVLAVVLGLLPVLSGALAGVVAVALGFGVVHGVTLGFGATLIGEAVDYSVYLLVQSQRSDARGADTGGWVLSLWPTIRLGMLTSICGFAALLPSAFPGLAQLGLYSIAGLIAAGLVTRYVLPRLLPMGFALASGVPLGRALAAGLEPLRAGRRALWAVPLIAAVVLATHRAPLWSHELNALSPVSRVDQAFDGELRAELGAPDVRVLVVLQGKTPEAVLEASETLGVALDRLVADGVLVGYQSPSRYLPSVALQRRRQAALPPPDVLRARLAAAVAALPIAPTRLAPFLEDVEAARDGRLVGLDDLAGTSLETGVAALLVQRGDEWTGLMPLQAARDGSAATTANLARVRRTLEALRAPGVEATLVDLKAASDSLYSGYLAEALRLCALGLLAIVVLLAIALRSVVRTARVVAPLLLAVVTVLAGFAVAGEALNILHLIGMLLIVAVGSNYALFFDRETTLEATLEDPLAASRLLGSLALANLCTVIGFGVLAFSSVPVLSALGSTVAPGALLALIFSAALARAA